MPGSAFCSRYPSAAPGAARRGHCRLTIDRRTHRRGGGRGRFALGTRRQDAPAGRALTVPGKLRSVPELAAVVTPRQLRRSPCSQARPKSPGRSVSLKGGHVLLGVPGLRRALSPRVHGPLPAGDHARTAAPNLVRSGRSDCTRGHESACCRLGGPLLRLSS